MQHRRTILHENGTVRHISSHFFNQAFDLQAMDDIIDLYTLPHSSNRKGS